MCIGGVAVKIEEEIQLYISSKEITGALLLTGKWGSGKTYLIHKVKEKINQQGDAVVLIISLFGLENIDELNRKVKESLFQSRFNKDIDLSNKERFSQIKNFTSIISEYSRVAKGINSVLSINLYDFVRIEKKIEYLLDNKLVEKDLVLVFDDFERSKIDMINLIGTINDYTENKGIRTILIADEEKINEKKYIDFKEKLIFRTIRLKPDYSVIINEIISNYSETTKGYSDFLKENQKTIEQVFYESELENIRSLKAMIIDFERIYTKWMGINIGIENMANVLYTYGATLLEHRAGNYNKSEYGYLSDDAKLREKYSNFNKNNSRLLSLQNWVTTGEWNEVGLEYEIKDKYKVKCLTDDAKFLLCSFWNLNNRIITNGLEIVLNKAYDGELTTEELISLLQKLHAIDKYKVNVSFKPNYKKMMEGLEKRLTLVKEGKLTEQKRYTIIMDETLVEMEEGANKLYHKIEWFDTCLITWENRLEFIDYMENADIARYKLKGKCIACFDNDLLNIFIRRYKSYGNYEKREIGLALYNLNFTEPLFSDHDDILVSKKNFVILKKELELFIAAEEDEISKVITYEQIKLLGKMISKA